MYDVLRTLITSKQWHAHLLVTHLRKARSMKLSQLLLDRQVWSTPSWHGQTFGCTVVIRSDQVRGHAKEKVLNKPLRIAESQSPMKGAGPWLH